MNNWQILIIFLISFNRTIVELKQITSDGLNPNLKSFNRTIVELKREQSAHLKKESIRFNRTIVECFSEKRKVKRE